jgi:hypothetical protein
MIVLLLNGKVVGTITHGSTTYIEQIRAALCAKYDVPIRQMAEVIMTTADFLRLRERERRGI